MPTFETKTDPRTAPLRPSFVKLGATAFSLVALLSQSPAEAQRAEAQSAEGSAAPSLSGSTSSEPSPSAEVQAPAESAPTAADKSPSDEHTEEATPPVVASAEDVRLLRLELQELRSVLRETQVALKDAPAPAAPPPSPEKAPLTTLSKGKYYLGGTFGLSYKDKNNVETLFGTVDDGKRVRTNIDGLFGRVLIDNQLAAGMIIQYTMSSKKGILTNPETGEADDQLSKDYSLSGGPVIRQFLPLGNQNRLFIYYQAALLVGYTEKVTRSFKANSSSVSSSNGYKLGLAVQPGIMIAASDHFAIEMGINLLGIDYTHYKTTTDYDNEGTENEASVNVDVNLLSLQFAFVGYF